MSLVGGEHLAVTINQQEKITSKETEMYRKKVGIPHKILILESGFGKGGSSIALYNILKEIDRKIFYPIIGLYYWPYMEYVKKLKNLGLEVLQYNMLIPKEMPREKKIIMKYPSIFFKMAKKELPIALKIAWQIRQKQIKMVMFNNDLGLHTIGFLAAKITRRPCVVTKAGYGFRRKITRMLSPYVNGFFAISNAAAQDQLFDYPKLKEIPIIYRGIPLKNFDPFLDASDIRNNLGILHNHIVVTSISRISFGKGQFELIQAAKDVVKLNKNVKFLVVGDDVDLEGKFLLQLKEQVRHLKLQKYFIFTGWRSDIPELLAATDIFVHCPTHWMEALGIAAIEAAAMAKPMIISNNYGLAETVIDGKTGFIVKKEDTNGLAQAIIKLAVDKELRLSLGKNARKLVEERFDSKKNTQQIEKYLLQFVPSD